MENETVPFHYVINKLSNETQELFKYLFSVFGISSLSLLAYILYRRDKF